MHTETKFTTCRLKNLKIYNDVTKNVKNGSDVKLAFSGENPEEVSNENYNDPVIEEIKTQLMSLVNDF